MAIESNMVPQKHAFVGLWPVRERQRCLGSQLSGLSLQTGRGKALQQGGQHVKHPRGRKGHGDSKVFKLIRLTSLK